jgi:hypothetical protein
MIQGTRIRDVAAKKSKRPTPNVQRPRQKDEGRIKKVMFDVRGLMFDLHV